MANIKDAIMAEAFLISAMKDLDKYIPTSFVTTGSPMYQPKRTKFKGYMRERRICSFNKNK